MNQADTELVGGILTREGFSVTSGIDQADVVLLNTCAIRENAEQRIRGRLGTFQSHKRQRPELVVGILGCMAERLRSRFMDEEKLVDIVIGPDEYRKLPGLLTRAFSGEKGIAVQLSRVENYEDIEPLRTDGLCAWIAVMRGCDKFCTFCVVPFTRGRERSKPLQSIVDEVRRLRDRGYKEVTLLGQNVNSYADGGHDFADLMSAVAAVDTTIRVRFTTSHPQDMSDKLIDTIAATPNLCKYIHLPVQSGSDRMLTLMNRSYTVGHYLKLVSKIRQAMPGASLTTDIISGFPGETEQEHRMTVDLMREVRYDGAYTFKYSAREKTKAWEMGDSISEEVKSRRVTEIVVMQQQMSDELNQPLVGTCQRVLVEGPSKKSDAEFSGRTDTNKTVVFPVNDGQVGEYVDLRIERANSATLFGRRCDGTQKNSEQQ
jgi:tRNA-2-methylthio-N6-dimethylallyladenosine synthase